MHTYEFVGSPDDHRKYPITESDQLRCAEDVVAKAARWPMFGRGTCAEVMHLDELGHTECGWRPSSFQSLLYWNEHREDLTKALLHARLERCDHERWLVVDSRPTSLGDLCPPVSEADAKAFTEIRMWLGERGVELVDTVVFDDQQHWWSMRELTMGTTRWLPDPGVIDHNAA